MAATTRAAKRCHYEVLNLPRDCTQEAIRTAYKKLALQRHPDKLIQSGTSHIDATSQFQELLLAYQTLSDPKQRSYYDSHRTQILFTDKGFKGCNSIPNLDEYFSPNAYSGYEDGKRGFYRVYEAVFQRVYECELGFASLNGNVVKDMPLMGDLGTGYEQVAAFYAYWLSFVTVMDFSWVDEFDVMSGINRKSRRVMEEENNKLRKKAKREYNEGVRKLAEFVRKRDKRVVEMTRKREEERVRKVEEEKERRRNEERVRFERAMRFEEPDWAKVEEEDDDDDEEDEEERKEFYCVVCGKKFKSEKQWKNHEQSKKHKEKVAELRESFVHEDEEFAEAEAEAEEMERGEVKLSDGDDEVEELEKRFRESVVVEDVEEDEEGEEEIYFDANDLRKGGGGFSGLDGLNDDDETSVLEAMVSGRKKSAGGRNEKKVPVEKINVEVEDKDDQFGPMEYNKKAPKVRKPRRAKNKKSGFGNRDEGSSCANADESTFQSRKEDENGFQEDEQFVESHKNSSQAGDIKGAAKKETSAKTKISSKGKKAKASSKNTSNECEKCGEEFESRTKLHKHLNEMGHSSLKFK